MAALQAQDDATLQALTLQCQLSWPGCMAQLAVQLISVCS